MIVRLSKNSSVDFGPLIVQMEKGELTPRQVSDGMNLVAGSLSRMRFIMGVLAAKRAETVNEYRSKYKSQAETERAWEATDLGQKEAELHHQIKALEGVLSALKTHWYLLQGEAKGRH